jgi:hypothetical protein
MNHKGIMVSHKKPLLTHKVVINTINSDMKNGVFWVVTPCGSCKNRRFGGTWRLLHQGSLVLTRATRCNNPEDTILHSHRRENLKSYKFWYVSYHLLQYFPNVLMTDLSACWKLGCWWCCCAVLWVTAEISRSEFCILLHVSSVDGASGENKELFLSRRVTLLSVRNIRFSSNTYTNSNTRVGQSQWCSDHALGCMTKESGFNSQEGKDIYNFCIMSRSAPGPNQPPIKNGVFWDVTPHGSCKSRRFS